MSFGRAVATVSKDFDVVHESAWVEEECRRGARFELNRMNFRTVDCETSTGNQPLHWRDQGGGLEPNKHATPICELSVRDLGSQELGLQGVRVNRIACDKPITDCVFKVFQEILPMSASGRYMP